MCKAENYILLAIILWKAWPSGQRVCADWQRSRFDPRSFSGSKNTFDDFFEVDRVLYTFFIISYCIIFICIRLFIGCARYVLNSTLKWHLEGPWIQFEITKKAVIFFLANQIMFICLWMYYSYMWHLPSWKKPATMKGYGDTNCSRSIYTGTNMQGVKIIPSCI